MKASRLLNGLAREWSLRIHKPQRLLFDHLPKCGGTTTNNYLHGHYPARLVFHTNPENPLESVEKFRALSQAQRHSYLLITGHASHLLMDLVHPATLKLTILREPLDRLISQFHYVKQNTRHHLHQKVTSRGMDLEEYITSGPGQNLANWYTVHFSGMSLGQVNEHPEEALQLAATNILNRYDLIGFQDDLQAIMDLLRSKAGFGSRFSGVVQNKTLSRPKVERLPSGIRSLLQDMHRLDLRLYQYLHAFGAGECKQLRGSKFSVPTTVADF